MAHRASHDRRLSATFAALADPTRRAILARLIAGPASVTELAGPFEMSMPAVSKHLKVLERAGMVERGRAGQLRPCTLAAAPLQDACRWLSRYRRCWAQNPHRPVARAAQPTAPRRQRKAKEKEKHDRNRRSPRHR
jgi:DNA-binding transcriptional ArsR family regulator